MEGFMLTQLRRIAQILAIVTLALVCSTTTTVLLAQVPSKLTHDLAQVYPVVNFWVALPLGKQPAIEYTKLSFPFYLNVLPGPGGARPTYDFVVCKEDSDQCVYLPQVTPPWTNDPKLTLDIDAPAAGQAVSITFVACIASTDANSVHRCGKRLANDSESFDFKMRFVVSLDSFTILHTRAQSNDTVYWALTGITDGMGIPSNCADKLAEFRSPSYCSGPRLVGDRQDGTYPVNASVGEFE